MSWQANLKYETTWAFPLKPGPSGGARLARPAWCLTEAATITLGVATFHLKAGDFVVFLKARNREPELLSKAQFERAWRRQELNS